METFSAHRYQAPQPALWTGRTDQAEDAQPIYWHQAIHCLDLQQESPTLPAGSKHGFAILGYACDEGVRRNQGRVGAAAGPDAIRRLLAPAAYHLPAPVSVCDTGSVYCKDENLEASQEALSKAVTVLLRSGYFPLLLGGGHDIAYAHYRGIRAYVGPEVRLGIINLDAHFDLRQPPGRGNSGTPFWQVARESEAAGLPFHYLCLGIQRAANIRSLFATAHRLGVSYLYAEEMQNENWENVRQQIDTWLRGVDAAYLTIDLDGFSAAYAPGVSAPSPLGYSPGMALRIIEQLAGSGKLISLDVAELNPAYDQDNATARLAARLLEQATFYLSAAKK